MYKYIGCSGRIIVTLLAIAALSIAKQGLAQQTDSLENLALYEALKKFELRGSAKVEELVLKRDRAEMEFTGDFYFAAPINGRITGAVFIGEGTFGAPAPHIKFEEENLIRLLGENSVESDFRLAVLRFTDDTIDIIGERMKADEGALRIVGWKARRTADQRYLVSYTYYDDSGERGWLFEVDLAEENIRCVSNNP